jgi:hypothetical protein
MKTQRQLARERKLGYVTIKINTDYLPDAECARIGCYSNSETNAVANADQIKRLNDIVIEILTSGSGAGSTAEDGQRVLRQRDAEG